MHENTHNLGELPVETFFGIVSAEVFIWDTVQDALQKACVPVGIGRLIPLMHLSAKPMRLHELTNRMRAKESAASRLVERMVKDGLITKERAADDGRAVTLHITEEGRHVEEAGRKAFLDCLRRVFGDFTIDELRALCSALARLDRSRVGKLHD